MLFCDPLARSTRWTVPWRMQPSKVSCGAGIGAQTMRAMRSISGFWYADHGRVAHTSNLLLRHGCPRTRRKSVCIIVPIADEGRGLSARGMLARRHGHGEDSYWRREQLAKINSCGLANVTSASASRCGKVNTPGSGLYAIRIAKAARSAQPLRSRRRCARPACQ